MDTQPRRRTFGLYAITILLLTNAALIVLDVSRSYVSLGLEFGLPRPDLDWLSNIDLDRLLRFLIAATYLVVAIGLWTFRRWAWTALMLLVGAALAEGLVLYFRDQPRYQIMFINVLIVFYINQRSVQLLFKRDRQEPTSA